MSIDCIRNRRNLKHGNKKTTSGIEHCLLHESNKKHIFQTFPFNNLRVQNIDYQLTCDANNTSMGFEKKKIKLVNEFKKCKFDIASFNSLFAEKYLCLLFDAFNQS